MNASGRPGILKQLNLFLNKLYIGNDFFLINSNEHAYIYYILFFTGKSKKKTKKTNQNQEPKKNKKISNICLAKKFD